jgi:GH35 family endo-1,4-beta-xylanase
MRINISVPIIIFFCFVVSCNLFKHEEELPYFMFNVDEVGHREKLGGSYVQELKNSLYENMVFDAVGYRWGDFEPVDDEFDWDELDDFISDNSKKHIVLRVGPPFEALGGGVFRIGGEGTPSWLENNLSNPSLRSEYGEFLSALANRYKDDLDMWWVGEEVNMGGDGLSWEEKKDWVAWQVELIRAYDSTTNIAISFGSWTDYHEAIPSNAIHEIAGASELISEGVDFDCLAIEYHYGTLQDGDIDDLKQAISDLKTVGKKIFIWEVFYPGKTDSVYEDNWDWTYPPAGGYSEEWQSEQLYETLKLAYEDTMIIGINLFHFQEITYNEIDPTDWEAGWRCHAGLVGNDGTPKEAYSRIRDYWREVSVR